MAQAGGPSTSAVLGTVRPVITDRCVYATIEASMPLHFTLIPVEVCVQAECAFIMEARANQWPQQQGFWGSWPSGAAFMQLSWTISMQGSGELAVVI